MEQSLQSSRTVVDAELENIEKALDRLNKTIYGYNGDAKNSIVTKMEIQDRKIESMQADLTKIKNTGYTIAIMVVGLIVTALWNVITNPITGQVIIVVTATPHP